MPHAETFAETFAALRAMLARQGKRLLATTDTPGDYMLASPTRKDPAGRPLFIAGVQTRKNYVSFHLMPIYMDPTLLAEVSPALRQRMQGKACFNFKTVEPAQLKELSALTKKGIERFKTIKLPWDSRSPAAPRAR